MKLRNKKTGEITIASNIAVGVGKDGEWYDSLAKLNEEWEDYEEPKDKYCWIDYDGEIVKDSVTPFDSDIDDMKAIGNYFETKEEAEKAVEKLKAWKRLKDKGFRFCGHDDRDRGQLGDIVIYAEMPTFEYDDDLTRDDLDICFGGEE